MKYHAIPCIIMASITFYMGLYHLIIFLKRRRMPSTLFFALICFSVGLYDIFCVGLYSAESLAQGVFWQDLQLKTVNFISSFIILFVAYYTHQQKNRIIHSYVSFFILLFIISLFIDDRYTLTVLQPDIKTVRILHDYTITYYESQIGPVYTTVIFASITAYIYLLYLLVRFYKQTGIRNSIYIMAGQVIYFIGVINDSSVASGLYDFIYISEYSFLVIILAMSYVLLNGFISLYSKVEEYSMNLEDMVIERTQEIEKLNKELLHQAEMDALTGIYNRWFFNKYFEIEVIRAANEVKYKNLKKNNNTDMNFGVAIIDIDNFKTINDTYGHLTGDQVLVETVDVIKNNIFTRDIFCRYGGEEFIILFTRTSREGIILAVEKIRTSVENHTFHLDQNIPDMSITISIGAVTFDEVNIINSNKILQIADDRLLLAKRSGKNRAVFDT